MDSNLKALRLSLGLTQGEFAKSVGVAKSTYSNYEIGFREPRSDFWSFVAKKYDVTIDYLLGLSSDPHTYSDGTVKGPRFVVTSAERSYLSKVRALDDSGRALVKMVIDHEHERCSAPAAEAAPADDDSNVVNLTGLFPHLGLASAGPGALAQDAPVDWEQRGHAPRGATATMTIKGHSMEPLYHDGDLIWVDTTRPAEKVGRPYYVYFIVSRFSRKSRKIFRLVLFCCVIYGVVGAVGRKRHDDGIDKTQGKVCHPVSLSRKQHGQHQHQHGDDVRKNTGRDFGHKPNALKELRYHADKQHGPGVGAEAPPSQKFVHFLLLIFASNGLRPAR